MFSYNVLIHVLVASIGLLQLKKHAYRLVSSAETGASAEEESLSRNTSYSVLGRMVRGRSTEIGLKSLLPSLTNPCDLKMFWIRQWSQAHLSN